MSLKTSDEQQQWHSNTDIASLHKIMKSTSIDNSWVTDDPDTQTQRNSTYWNIDPVFMYLTTAKTWR